MDQNAHTTHRSLHRFKDDPERDEKQPTRKEQRERKERSWFRFGRTRLMAGKRRAVCRGHEEFRRAATAPCACRTRRRALMPRRESRRHGGTASNQKLARLPETLHGT